MFKRMILAEHFGGFACGLFPCLQTCTSEIGHFCLYSKDLVQVCKSAPTCCRGKELGKRSPSAKSCSCLQIRRAELHFVDCPNCQGVLKERVRCPTNNDQPIVHKIPKSLESRLGIYGCLQDDDSCSSGLLSHLRCRQNCFGVAVVVVVVVLWQE